METETRLDEQSAAVQAAAAAEKQDMEKGADVKVPTGQESVSEARSQPRIDPADARKALFKTSREQHAQDRAEGRARGFEEGQERTDGMDMVLAAEKAVNESAAREDAHNDLDRTAHLQTEKPSPAPAASQAAGQQTTTRVKVYGKEFDAPTAEVEEAGGVVPYQKLRAAEMQLAEAARIRKLAAQERADTAALAEKLQAQQKAPATTDAASAGAETLPNGASGDADVQAQAEALTEALYTGDKAKVKSAVATILTANRGAVIDPKQVAALAAEQLRRETTETPVDYDEHVKAQNAEANAWFRKEHAEVFDDPDKLAVAQRRFQELRNDPNNEGRTPMQLAKEVGRYVGEKFAKHPRQGVVERKREVLPAAPQGGGRAPEDTPRVDTPSEYIARLRRASGRTD